MTSWRDFESLGQRDDLLFSTGPRGASRQELSGSRSESSEEMVRRLDAEFDKMLAEMKPHVMRLPHKTGEIRSS